MPHKQSRKVFNKKHWTRCGACSGTGFAQKLFSHSDDSACIECNCVGWLPPDGEKLSEHEALVFIRKSLDRKAFGLRLSQRERGAVRDSPLVEFYRQPGYKGD